MISKVSVESEKISRFILVPAYLVLKTIWFSQVMSYIFSFRVMKDYGLLDIQSSKQYFQRQPFIGVLEKAFLKPVESFRENICNRV